MSQKTNAVAVRTIGIDTGKNTFHLIGLVSCSLSRGVAQFFTPPPRTAPIVSAHSRRQDPKTPVEQALMRGLGTA